MSEAASGTTSGVFQFPRLAYRLVIGKRVSARGRVVQQGNPDIRLCGQRSADRANGVIFHVAILRVEVFFQSLPVIGLSQTVIIGIIVRVADSPPGGLHKKPAFLSPHKSNAPAVRANRRFKNRVILLRLRPPLQVQFLGDFQC